MLFDWMAQGQFRVHAVLIAARVLFLPPTADVARFFQFVQNALHGPVGDTDLLRNVLDPHLRILSQTDQHVRLIGQKRPRSRLGPWGLRFSHGLVILRFPHYYMAFATCIILRVSVDVY